MNLSKNIRVRPAMAKDAGLLIDLEIKTQDGATTLEIMKKYLLDSDKCGFIASIGSRDVGYAACALSCDKEGDKRLFRLLISRLGVHVDFRNLGVSKSLMVTIAKKALEWHCDTIVVGVPSYKIDDPGDPDYIGWWFQALDFKATSVDTEFYYRYGKWWDAYLFERAP